VTNAHAYKVTMNIQFGDLPIKLGLFANIDHKLLLLCMPAVLQFRYCLYQRASVCLSFHTISEKLLIRNWSNSCDGKS